MFENSNKGIVKEIARETMKVHRLRNLMACFAIALTAILITAICGAGTSTVKAIMTEAQMNPGPGTGGAGIYGSLDTLKKVRQQPQVVFADIARPCMNGTPRNQEFAGNMVHFLAVNKGYYKHHYVDLVSGAYPKNETEVLMSDTLAKKTHRDRKPGQKMTLNLMVLKNGKTVQKPVEVTISGFYDNPLRAIENYEELYTAPNFPDVYNPELKDTKSTIFTQLKGVNSQTSNTVLKAKLDKLNNTVGGHGVTYIMAQDFTLLLVGTAALLLLIMACGYFLIYNIFYISIVNDIRFIGSMKTIGMTGKQIRTMLNWQVIRLGGVGTIGGILIGSGLSLMVTRLLQTMEFSFSRYYQVGSSMILAVIAAVIFTAITVWFSSRRALSLAAKVSPVEASRFRTSGRKKTIFAVVSFTLSGILFSVLFTAMVGYDTEWMVERMHETDFHVFQYHAGQIMEEPYEPMDTSLVSELKKLDFVKESYTYYRAYDPKQKFDSGWYKESISDVKYAGDLKTVLDKEFKEIGLPKKEQQALIEDGNYKTGIMGLEAKSLNMEAKNLNIYDGTLDSKKFADGNYLIYLPLNGNFAEADYVFNGVKAGEKLTFSFYDYGRHKYVTKTFTVMAVAGTKMDRYGGQFDPGVQLAMSDKSFRSIYGSAANDMICSLRLNTMGGGGKQQQKVLESKVAEYFNTQVQIVSKYKTRLSEQTEKNQKVCIGIFVGLFIGLIGMANIVNTIITGVLSRKLEFAALQSIGMTKGQMAITIFRDGLKMVLISLAIMIPIGLPVTIALAQYPLSTGFVPSIYGMACAMAAAAGISLAAAVGYVLTQVLNRNTIVERLREAD